MTVPELPVFLDDACRQLKPHQASISNVSDVKMPGDTYASVTEGLSYALTSPAAG